MIERFGIKTNITFQLTLGKLSLKYKATKIKSSKDKNKANSAGTTNQFPLWLWDHFANAAPMTGPIIKPTEKAMPTKA